MYSNNEKTDMNVIKMLLPLHVYADKTFSQKLRFFTISFNKATTKRMTFMSKFTKLHG
jgi:hypothetical protein